MKPTPWEAVVTIGVIISQITSIRISSRSTDCLAALDTCLSDLCKSEQAFLRGICEVNDEGCQIKGSKICNMTIQAILHQFPSMQACLCAWEEEPCASIQALTAQCHPKPALQKRSTSEMDWQSSILKGYVYDGTGSCLKQMEVCLDDEICNRYLVPFVQACATKQCNRTHCLQATRQFYSGMPYNVAEMLFMCECEAGAPDCLHIKKTLHSGTCGEEMWTCQEGLNHCLADWHCRNVFQTFQAKCWHPELTQCSDSENTDSECVSQMNPALVLGGDIQCKMAFLATVGTTLHYPCTCKGLHDGEMLKCNTLHDIFHNRSLYMIPLKITSASFKPPEVNESEQGPEWVTDYLLYAFVYTFVAGLILLMPIVVVFYKVWMMRRGDKTKFQPPKKRNCVVIL